MSSPSAMIPAGLWLKTKIVARLYMEEVAAKGGLTHYAPLAQHIASHLAADYVAANQPLIRAHDLRLEELLGEILWEEVSEKRPPLTCLVTLKEDPSRCGGAFYTRCEEYGLYNPNTTSRLEFWSLSLRQTHNYYWKRRQPPATSPKSSYVSA